MHFLFWLCSNSSQVRGVAGFSQTCIYVMNRYRIKSYCKLVRKRGETQFYKHGQQNCEQDTQVSTKTTGIYYYILGRATVEKASISRIL